MTKKNTDPKVDRRKFIAGVALAGAAGAVSAGDAAKAAASPPTAAPSALRPTAAEQAAETKGTPLVWGNATGKPGSDFMVDVIKSLDVDYINTNPASSCRGLHESLNNYGMNIKPELLTVMHEESGAGMAHGYFKVTGKPMMCLFHGTVGLQHAAMAIYNAWCDRVPMIVLVGNGMDATARRPGVPTAHAALDPISMVRDFTKWDDQPYSLQHFAESMVRAYKVCMTPPMEPVAISIDEHLQESPIPEGTEELRIPKYTATAPPQGDSWAVREAARLLANAENPVIVVDRCARTAEGMALVTEFAETLNAAVIDRRGRLNIPNMHYLVSGGDVIGQADVIIGLELTDFFGTVNRAQGVLHRTFHPRIRPGTRLISIGIGDLYIRANFQDFQRFQAVDVSIGADAQATLPALIEAVRSEIPASRRAAIEQRGETRRRAHAQARQASREAAMFGWNANPISTARLAAEIWQQIQNEDWAAMGDDLDWTNQLWTFDKHHQYIGAPTGTGAGQKLPAAVGAALGHREHGRLAINIQNDGDFMYANGALWTSAYHNIPMLSIMNNNRAYHQEVMHVHRVGLWRDRGADRAHIGTEITNPDIQYAMLARSMGVEGIGQITDPGELAGAIKRGIEVVKSGESALIDVVMQGR